MVYKVHLIGWLFRPKRSQENCFIAVWSIPNDNGITGL